MSCRFLLPCILGLLLGQMTLIAQPAAPLPSGPAGFAAEGQLDAFLDPVYVEGPPFIAKLETILENPQGNKTNTVMFAADSGKIRKVVNFEDAGGKPLTPEALANLKNAGLDYMVTILRHDRGQKISMLPRTKSYTTEEWKKKRVAMVAGKARLQNLTTEKLGQEQIDGLPCTKEIWTIKNEDGDVQIHVWRADTLNGLVVRWQGKYQDSVATLTLREIKTGKVDSSLFEIPAGFRRYQNHSDLMKAAILQSRQAPK